MKTRYLLLLLLLPAGQAFAQSPDRVAEALSMIHGDFSWEIRRLSDNKVRRTGTRQSEYKLDSTLLYSIEYFDNADIEQVSLVGYNPQRQEFFSVGVYNIDPGPHIMYGKLRPDSWVIDYVENDSSRLALEIISRNEHRWTSEKLVAGQWQPHDLLIVFKRNKRP